jgi:uncharacterized membrane protein YgcG
MEPHGRVQVVLGEAERADGLLRFVLEAEGFDLVGLASNDEELERVLRGARPSVVVLDGGISAAAALHARECLEDAALVVVWPDGVSAVLAEERVEPNLVIEDLGDAVRRAADRLRQPIEPIVVSDAEHDGAEVVLVESVRTDPPPAPLPRTEVRRGRPWLRGRKMQILVGATTWFLAITALAAIATAVPHVVDTFRGGRSPRVSPSVTTEPQSRTDTTSDQTSGEEQQDRCADPVSGEGNVSAQGNGTPVRAQGCPPEKTDRGNTGGNGGGGRPDDPGSQGNGGASGGQGSNGETGSSDDVGSHGSSGEDHGPPGSGKPEGTESGPKSEPKAEGVHGRSDEVVQGARNG